MHPDSSRPTPSPSSTSLIGRRLGVYDVQALVGAGGMGEVYRAHDTRLGRHVAIKVLPQAFTADADRLTRFEREARMLATLNHPNIAAIHGIEESGGMTALVLEFVDGVSLDERIRQGRGSRSAGHPPRDGDRRCSRGSRRLAATRPPTFSPRCSSVSRPGNACRPRHRRH